MTEREGTVLICAPHIEGNEVITGSAIGACELCQCSIDVAPTGQEMLLKDPKVRLLCIKCGLEMIEEDPEPVIGPPTPEQDAELEAWRRRN